MSAYFDRNGLEYKKSVVNALLISINISSQHSQFASFFTFVKISSLSLQFFGCVNLNSKSVGRLALEFKTYIKASCSVRGSVIQVSLLLNEFFFTNSNSIARLTTFLLLNRPLRPYSLLPTPLHPQRLIRTLSVLHFILPFP